MRLFKALVASAVLLGAAGTAQAVPTTWVDAIDFNPDRYVGNWSSTSYTHNINDNGYTPFVDLVTGFSLEVDLFDDRDGFLTQLEIAVIDVPGLVGDSVYSFDLSGSEFGGWSLVGHLQLALTGLYDVTISSLLGDFYVGGSTLTAWGEGSTSVPEPDMLILMGLGLLGAGTIARKKKKA